MLTQDIAITGMGVVSKLGMSLTQLNHALQQGRSAIEFMPSFAEFGLKSQVAALVDVKQLEPLPRKLARYSSNAALYAWHAAQQALTQARLPQHYYAPHDIGILVGQMTGPSDSLNQLYAHFSLKGTQRLSPFMVPKTMASSASSLLSIGLGFQGVSQTIAAACASSAYAIMQACDELRLGRQQCMLVGGTEEVTKEFASIFDAMNALSSHYNATPQQAAKPFDLQRDGFVIADGAAFLVLETVEHAIKRDAPIFGVIEGYASTSDGEDMVSPSGVGAQRAMELTLARTQQYHAQPVHVDYINAHATGTQAGDAIEARAIEQVLKQHADCLVSSTKSLSGHLLGSAGAFELIACTLMLNHGYLVPNANLTDFDANCALPNLLMPSSSMTHRLANKKPVTRMLSNSFGFGGVNACISLRSPNYDYLQLN